METELDIREVRDKTSKTGRPFWTVVTNLGGMNTFDQTVATTAKAHVGKKCRSTYEEQGTFKNLVSVGEIIGDASPAQPVRQSGSPFQKSLSDDKQRTIVRQVALKCAVECTEDPSRALEVAEKFENWVLR